MGLIRNPAEVILDIISNEVGSDTNIDSASYNLAYDYHQNPTDGTISHPVDFTVYGKQIDSKRLIEGIASNSFLMPYFKDNELHFQIFLANPDYLTDLTDSIPSGIIKVEDIISYKNGRTAPGKIITKSIVEYHYDYELEEYLGNTFTDVNNTNHDTASEFFNDGDDPHGSGQEYNLINLGLTEEQEDIFEADYIRTFDSAIGLQQFLLLWNCNQHNILKLRLPLKYIKLNIGDLVEFDKMINGVKLFGEDYSHSVNYTGNEVFRNAQQILPIWMVTSSNKTLEYIDIELIQMHNCSPDLLPSTEVEPEIPEDDESPLTPVIGCTDPTASNYGYDSDGNEMPPEGDEYIWVQEQDSCLYASGGLKIELSAGWPSDEEDIHIEEQEDGSWDIYFNTDLVSDWEPGQTEDRPWFILKLINDVVDPTWPDPHYLFKMSYDYNPGMSHLKKDWRQFYSEGGLGDSGGERIPLTLHESNLLYDFRKEGTAEDVFPGPDDEGLVSRMGGSYWRDTDGYNYMQFAVGKGYNNPEEGQENIGAWLHEWLASDSIPVGAEIKFWKGLFRGLMVPNGPWIPRTTDTWGDEIVRTHWWANGAKGWDWDSYNGYYDPYWMVQDWDEDWWPDTPYTEFLGQQTLESTQFPEFRIHKGMPGETPEPGWDCPEPDIVPTQEITRYYPEGWNLVSYPMDFESYYLNDSYVWGNGNESEGLYLHLWDALNQTYTPQWFLSEWNILFGGFFYPIQQGGKTVTFDGPSGSPFHGNGMQHLNEIWYPGCIPDASGGDRDSYYWNKYRAGWNLIGCPATKCDIISTHSPNFDATAELIIDGGEGVNEGGDIQFGSIYTLAEEIYEGEFTVGDPPPPPPSENIELYEPVAQNNLQGGLAYWVYMEEDGDHYTNSSGGKVIFRRLV